MTAAAGIVLCAGLRLVYSLLGHVISHIGYYSMLLLFAVHYGPQCV